MHNLYTQEHTMCTQTSDIFHSPVAVLINSHHVVPAGKGAIESWTQGGQGRHTRLLVVNTDYGKGTQNDLAQNKHEG